MARSSSLGTIDKFRRQAFQYGKRYGLTVEDAEDFASDCIVEYLKGRKVSLVILFADFMRTKYGRNDRWTKNPKPGRPSKKSLSEAHSVEPWHLYESNLVSPDNIYKLKYYDKDLRVLEQKLLNKIVQGYTYKEIGLEYGLTEEAICAKLRKIACKIRLLATNQFDRSKKTRKSH